jgi:hypothetical protein
MLKEDKSSYSYIHDVRLVPNFSLCRHGIK